MSKWIRMSALALLLGLGAVGCQNTQEGLEKDASNTGQAVSKAAEQTGEAVSKAAENTGEAVSQAGREVSKGVGEAAGDIGAATTLTPDIKNAINADSALNDPKNLINVDSTDEMVHLKGHVTSNELKKKAGEIAQRVLTERKAKNKLNNELVVESR